MDAQKQIQGDEGEDDKMSGSGQGRAETEMRHDEPVVRAEGEGYEGLSALAEVAFAAADPKTTRPTWDISRSTHADNLGDQETITISLDLDGEQRTVRVLPGGITTRTIDIPLIGEFTQRLEIKHQRQQEVAFCLSDSEPFAFCSSTPRYNPILASILGSSEEWNLQTGKAGTHSTSSLSYSSKSEFKVLHSGDSGTPTTKDDQLPISLPPVRPDHINHRPAPIPLPLHPTPSANSQLKHYTSSSSLSPRHSPYASARSVPIVGGSGPRSARSFSGHSNSNSNSLERTLFSNMSPYSPSPSTPPPPPHHHSASSDNSPSSRSSGGRAPIASPPTSMSFSKRRRAPDWPSPRTNSSRSVEQAQATGPISAFSRDLAQTMHTPAVLRVPPTPVYSPAFYRSGLTTQPPPPPRAEPSHEPLHPRHTPFNSAPPLTATRLEHPRPPSPSPNGQSQHQGKKGRVNLMGIPKGWVIEQLNKRAGQYWHDPSSSDVRILVPIPRSRLPRHSTPNPSSRQPLNTGKPDSAQSFHSNQPEHSIWPITPQNTTAPAGNGEGDQQGLLGNVQADRGQGKRRGSLPGNDDIVALVFPLHQDYLLTQSSLFRQLLSPSAAHIDTPKSIKGARLLPTPPGTPPAIYLPLPDPPSFSVLVHWLYWGDTSALESALSKGLVEWQGVVKNVHQLGMDDGVKRVLGRWWRRWIKTDEGRARARMGRGVEDDDEEEELRDEEENGEDTEEEGRGMMLDHTEERGRVGDDEDVSGLLRAL